MGAWFVWTNSAVDPDTRSVVANQGSREIPFRLVNGNLIVVSVKAGGGGAHNFVLDTGADTTIVDSRLAANDDGESAAGGADDAGGGSAAEAEPGAGVAISGAEVEKTAGAGGGPFAAAATGRAD